MANGTSRDTLSHYGLIEPRELAKIVIVSIPL